jgi:hypothetical protein
MAVPFALISKPGATALIPSIDCPTATWEKFATTTVGVHTGGVSVPVGVKVGVGGVPVTVGVKVGVMSVPVGVGVGGVIVPVGVKVGVARVPVGVGVAAWLPARLRKMTMVCDAAFPCTIVTLTVWAFRFLLIKRSAGIVYMSVTE